MRLRAGLLLWHRWAGLVMALFLTIAGLTGAALAFRDPLDRALNPALHAVAPHPPGARPLDWLALRERVLAQVPGAAISALYMDPPGDGAAVLWLDAPVTPPGADRPYSVVHADPYTGRVIGFREPARLADGIGNLMPFLFELHYALALGEAGALFMGLIALVWSLDCLAGLWLTLPPAFTSGPSRRGWLRQWRQAFRVRWQGGRHRLTFDLHRAGGLWLWALLFVIAWSSVNFNLNQVYRPVMGSLFAFQPEAAPNAAHPAGHPAPTPPLPWRQLRQQARAHMAAFAAREAFAIHAETLLAWEAETGLVHYRVNSSRDVRATGGSTAIRFDPSTGRVVEQRLPTGAATGDSITGWLIHTHMANLRLPGLSPWPLRTAIAATGLTLALLTTTGLLLYTRKRTARRWHHHHRRRPQPAE